MKHKLFMINYMGIHGHYMLKKNIIYKHIITTN